MLNVALSLTPASTTLHSSSPTHKNDNLEVTGRPNPELADLMSIARGGGGFFDTGERYGSHAKTALGMGWVSG
jgi:hypothetical protein